MTPEDFMENLLRHYSKRHENDEAEGAWLEEMVGLVKGTEPRVLRRAYEMIRDEHEERAFPLPSLLRKYLSRAGDAIFPESLVNRGLNQWGEPRRAHISPELAEIFAKAAIFQKEVHAKYGSWENHLRATRHLRTEGFPAPRYEAPSYDPPHALRAVKVNRKHIRRRGVDTNRIVFEALQRRSGNQHLHLELSLVSKRMTGDS